jgi:hypothetical protein
MYNYGLYLLAIADKRLITLYLPWIWEGRGGGSKNNEDWGKLQVSVMYSEDINDDICRNNALN